MKRIVVCLVLAGASAAGAGAADTDSQTVLLVGADLHTVSHGVIAGGELLIGDGKILALGRQVEAPPGARRIDLTGKRIYPGLIAANSILGLTEVSAVRSTNDFSEAGASTPEVRAEVAVNPDTELWPVARANGVLSALVMPRAGSDGVIAGQAALMQADGWTYEQMTVAAPVGMVVAWPSARVPDWLPEDRKQRIREGVQKKRDALDRALRDARAYQAARQAGAVSVADLRDEALVPVIEGRMPLLVFANDAVQIREALAFAAREKLRLVIVGGGDAWRLAAAIKAQDVAVILGSSHNLPLRRWEGYDTVFAAAGKLAGAGVRLAIANDGDAMAAMNERNLPYQAASYAAHGLGSEAALHAITLGPAQILGVADRLGSLDAGKDATLFVADGDILDIRATVERAWVAGREVDLANKQSHLYQQYQRKYRGQPKG